ncbi:MAG: ATP-binding cassette domain-containing protein [Kofleriaceae bacterium]|nr:ATP-binding cassette domain-containing protein [Kofleriaceae bacterium]
MGALVTPIIQCIDVAVGYDEPVLEHVDLEVYPSEIVALLGASGSGKSTLLRALCGLQPPLAGELRLFGEPLYGVHGEQRAALLRRLGTAFQSDALFSSMTIEENVALPLRELTNLPETVIAEMVRMRLELVGIPELAGRNRAQISGGQRKRAALARASILDPPLILCDEPTAGLDPLVAAGIEHTLLQFRRVLGSTVVIVSHELESIRATADRAVMLANGRVSAGGTYDELARSADPTVRAFFHARAG